MTSRSFRVTALLLGTTLLGEVSAQTSTAVHYNYANIMFPGATLTSANGINNNNVIVGSYLDSAASIHGFVYRLGRYTAVNFPGATATEVLGINDYGDIVGVYQVPGPLNFHGFLRHNGKFTAINTPAAEFGTKAFGINKDGTIVGSYDDAHGFIYREGSYRTLDAPQLPGEQPNTQLNGINNLGWIVGQVFTGDIWRGFWIVGEDFDFLEPAGYWGITSPSTSPKHFWRCPHNSASSHVPRLSNHNAAGRYADSQVTGANGRGDIVGCHDATSGFISFHVESSEGSESSEKFPAQQRLVSCVSAINYARVVVGNYFTINQPQAFLAVPALTLRVMRPGNRSSLTNPVHLAASASGSHPISQIQVWVNFKEVFHSNSATLNSMVNLPVGTNERLVIQALDAKGGRAKVVYTVNVQ